MKHNGVSQRTQELRGRTIVGLKCFKVMLLCVCNVLLQLKCVQLNWLLLHCGKKKKSFLPEN